MVVLLIGFPHSVELLAGFCRKESPSPRYSLGLGVPGQATNDWCIILDIWLDM